jgi:hypothetical protein
MFLESYADSAFPAKSLDLETPPTTKLHTQPSFLDHSEQLIHRLREFSPAELGELMDLSDNLSALNVARYASWTKDTSEARQAVMTFNGDVYDGLDARTLKPAQLDYAQSRIRILSGLYGMLRPLDLIHPHRLEMGTRLNTARGKSLYDFWGDTITKALNQTARAGRGDAGQSGVGGILQIGQAEALLAGDYAAVRGLEERQVQNHLVLRQARTRPDGALRGRQRHHRSARS